VSISVRQPLAGRILDRKGCTFPILNAEFGAVVVTEMVFSEIPVQMLLTAVLITRKSLRRPFPAAAATSTSHSSATPTAQPLKLY
jgi:hypothetical protein